MSETCPKCKTIFLTEKEKRENLQGELVEACKALAKANSLGIFRELDAWAGKIIDIVGKLKEGAE